MPVLKESSIAFSILLLSSCTLSSTDTNIVDETDWKRQIDELALGELKSSGLPSLQIAIGNGKSIVFEGAYGLADVENNVPATTHTKYRTASVSKWLTASAAMALADKGMLDLDKPVQVYCPQFPQKKWPVTTRQLITHTSGVRHYADYDAALASAKTEDERNRIEARRLRDQLGTYTRYTDVIGPLANFKGDPLLFMPGSDWTYSSYGYRVLSCVIQGATAKDYSSVMSELVFSPLEMANTVEDDSFAIVPHRASGYTLGEGKSLQRAELRDVSENLAAGGHLSTATDLVKFALAFDSGQLLSAEVRTLMSRPLVNDDGPSAPTWRDVIPSREKYGYGMMMFPEGGAVRVGHTGRQAGSSSIVILDPENHISIAVMTNAKGWNGSLELTKAIERIASSYLRERSAER